tara:strand:+ start:5970 stop:6344 length:375 start_codon:yes stop_codon:yes gene_type:complete
MKYTIYDVVEILKPNSNYNIKSNEYSGLEWLDSADTKPTETEINNKISELDAAEAMKLLREERNVLLSETDWMVIKSQETGVAMSNAWKTYRQALRDLPASSTPTLDANYELDLSSVTWPTEPS